jgi:iron complex outermembrane receptor protein
MQNDPNTPNAVQYSSSINLPWLAISQNLSSATTIYASHGHGVEQFVTPNSALFANAGTQLGIARSKQTEFGLRQSVSAHTNWNASVFEIQRPLAYDVFDSGSFQSTRILDGTQKHQGLELGARYTQANFTLGGQAQWLKASIADVQQTTQVVGSNPTNVPPLVLRGWTEYRYASMPRLRTVLRVSHEGQRNVTEDGSIKLPAWTTWSASTHYETKVNNVASTWSLAVDNLTDKQYWREAPKQFGHYYLYPGAPRTIRATVQFRL